VTDKQIAIMELQQRLRNIQKSESDDPAVIPDGIFSEETRREVENFQRQNGLEVTGVVDYATWEAIKEAERMVIFESSLPVQVAPIKNSNLPLVRGMDNSFTDVLKAMLNHVAEVYVNFRFIEEEGFGYETEREVRRWQNVVFLEETGDVDKETWNSLAEFYLINE